MTASWRIIDFRWESMEAEVDFGSYVGRVLEAVIKSIYLKILYLLNIFISSLSGDSLLYNGILYRLISGKKSLRYQRGNQKP